MDLRQLRYFMAIVRCGSITRASLQLNVAQPALSLHVRNMEADLGTPLLFRTSHGVQPTEAGFVLMRHAQLILGQFEAAQQEIKRGVAEPAGEVRLGLPSSISQVLGVPLILAARAQYPKISLRIAEAMSGYVLDWLRGGRNDFGLLYSLVDDPGLRSISLLTEGLVLFAAADAPPPFADRSPIPFARLAECALILPSPGHGLRDLLDGRATEAGMRLEPTIGIDAYGAIKTLVERGLGQSILPAHAIQAEVAAGRLRAWSFDPPLVRTIYLAMPTDRPLSQAARAIDGLCRTTLTELVHSGAWASAQMRIVAGP